MKQRRPEPEYHQGGLLDTAKLPDLSTEEESRYQEIIRQLKEKAQPKQETIKATYLEQEAEKLASSSGGTISLEQARETVKARQNHVLADDDLLHFAHQNKPVSVAHALDNGPDFNGKSCVDPPWSRNTTAAAAARQNSTGTTAKSRLCKAMLQYTFSRFAEAAENKKKPAEVWSFAEVEEILDLRPELLNWTVCAAPDKELSRTQKNAIAEEILSITASARLSAMP